MTCRAPYHSRPTAMHQFIQPAQVPNALLQTTEQRPRTIDPELRLINLAAVTIPFAGFRRPIASPPNAAVERVFAEYSTYPTSQTSRGSNPHWTRATGAILNHLETAL